MRPRSVWELTCASCGAAIVTETATGVCPKCGTEYEIQWTAEYQPKPEKTHDLE
jgi:predicted RNA-binding Zn-ribbon protein involved in translation (DUF1610 family)